MSEPTGVQPAVEIEETEPSAPVIEEKPEIDSFLSTGHFSIHHQPDDLDNENFMGE